MIEFTNEPNEHGESETLEVITDPIRELCKTYKMVPNGAILALTEDGRFEVASLQEALTHKLIQYYTQQDGKKWTGQRYINIGKDQYLTEDTAVPYRRDTDNITVRYWIHDAGEDFEFNNDPEAIAEQSDMISRLTTTLKLEYSEEDS